MKFKANCGNNITRICNMLWQGIVKTSEFEKLQKLVGCALCIYLAEGCVFAYFAIIKQPSECITYNCILQMLHYLSMPAKPFVT